VNIIVRIFWATCGGYAENSCASHLVLKFITLIDERPKRLKESADGEGICEGLADRAVFGQALLLEDTADIRPRTLDSRD
jgi:hypothetical protein